MHISHQNSPHVHSGSLLQPFRLEDGVLGLWRGGGRHGEPHLLQGGSLGRGGPAAGGHVGVAVAVGGVVPVTVQRPLKHPHTSDWIFLQGLTLTLSYTTQSRMSIILRPSCQLQHQTWKIFNTNIMLASRSTRARSPSAIYTMIGF